MVRGKQQLKRDLEHITQEMYQRNRELAETNKTLSLLRAIDALVLETHESLGAVYTQIAHAITDAVDYPFVGVLTRSPQFRNVLELGGLSIKSKPRHRYLPGIPHEVHVSIDDPWSRGARGNQLISLDNMPVAQLGSMLNASETEAAALLADLPIKSLYLVKLTARHKLVGAILVGFFNTVDQLSGFDTLLLDRLSESVGVALDNKLLAEENRRVLRQLRESNAKLRLLDQTKDDFISMASHQLRTPLTSVKGYISLVLDGDAGPVKESQRKLLTQAFFSSQRMVYLIADLLNVSRLRTGKFIIEPTPVDLTAIVGDEVAQLVETAKGRNLALNYHKPAHFPTLQLDETKTRQVIMNFIDNAIYYTPAGGHIDVFLNETPKSIELKVVDDGIGVPKIEQHHLFSKFFRAKNAQKARPDGTGLGLFMAKKVVIAQGGAIIFSSQPGKGSTFGFTFPKSALVKTEVKAEA
jgi:signal transduction histidine kinase